MRKVLFNVKNKIWLMPWDRLITAKSKTQRISSWWIWVLMVKGILNFRNSWHCWPQGLQRMILNQIWNNFSQCLMMISAGLWQWRICEDQSEKWGLMLVRKSFKRWSKWQIWTRTVGLVRNNFLHLWQGRQSNTDYFDNKGCYISSNTLFKLHNNT